METISFARGVPAPECLPEEELADCARTVIEREGKSILSYGSGAGYTPLRELIGQWFGVHPYRVVLTNGSLQGLTLLAERYARGNNVMTEYPTYDGALKVLLRSGASLLVAVVDDDGMNIDDLELQLMGMMKPAFVYTIPTFQNPTGRTLPIERRRKMVKVLGSRGIMIVEDDPYNLIRFEGEAIPAIFDYADKNSIYLSSFSKMIAPGLRVGWMILPGGRRRRAHGGGLVHLHHAVADQPGDRARVHRPGQLRAEPAADERAPEGAARRDARRAREALLGRQVDQARGRLLHLARAAVRDEPAPRCSSVPRASPPCSAPSSAARQTALRLAFSFASPDEIEVGIERLAAAM